MTDAEKRQAWRRWLLRAATVLVSIGALAGLLALYEPAEEAHAGDHAVALMRLAVILVGLGLALSVAPLFIRRRTPTSDRIT